MAETDRRTTEEVVEVTTDTSRVILTTVVEEGMEEEVEEEEGITHTGEVVDSMAEDSTAVGEDFVVTTDAHKINFRNN